MLGALRCPDDGGSLKAGPRGSLACAGCGRLFEVIDGIPCLLPEDPGWTVQEAADAAAEQWQRDRESSLYDRLVGLRLFSLAEVPALLRPLGIRPSDRVIEVGCGTGRMTLPLAGRGARVIAVDHSLESLRRLRRRLSKTRFAEAVQVVQADATRLPVCAEWATCGVASGVLQHLPGDALRGRAVAELARVVAPNARIAVSVYQDVPVLRKLMPREGRHSGAICFRRFSKQEIRALLDPHFDLDRITGTLVYVLLAHGVRRSGFGLGCPLGDGASDQGRSHPEGQTPNAEHRT